MLGSLSGLVTGRLGQRTLIEVQNVGYWVFTGAWQPSGETTIYLHHHIREDMSDLYGFASLGDLGLFEQLITISGIGPKAALALLSLGSSERIREAIAQKDITFLTTAPGIGQKAAQKIVLELHNKLDSLEGLLGDATPQSDLVSALMGLGYKEFDIKNALRDMPEDITSLDQQIKWALQKI